MLVKRWHDGSCRGPRQESFLGCSERQFRRYRGRYEEDGLEGLVDRRLGKASARRIAVNEVTWMMDQYESHYAGWNAAESTSLSTSKYHCGLDANIVQAVESQGQGQPMINSS